jgi:hypothetical protein
LRLIVGLTRRRIRRRRLRGLAPASDAAGGATFATNGVGARVMYSATTTAIARPTIRPSTMPRNVPPDCFDCFVVRRGFAIV